MIEILGIKLSYEALGFILAFVASEVIGESKLKENSVAAMFKGLVDTLKPSRKEDEKVAALRARVKELAEELKGLGD
ncbi:MAG: hypothetical protein HOM38_08950 [Euryarchaeota archaeon]|jgi:hypothetical protein|nr:hypothetical protein [Euryarchaeota archaeon]